MRIFKIVLILSLISSNNIFAADLNIFSLGFYDFTKRGNDAVDLRFNKRFDKILFDLGPEEESLYQIRPFYGLEVTHHGAATPPVATVVTVAVGINIDITGVASATNPVICFNPLKNSPSVKLPTIVVSN